MSKRVLLAKLKSLSIQNRSSIKDDSLNRLQSGGFIFPTELPQELVDYLTLPADITNISDQDLGQYLNAFVQQKNWIITLLATLEVEQMDIESTYNDLYSDCYENCPYTNVNDKKEYANTRKEVRYWSRMLYRANATLRMAERNLETLDNGVFLLSREITRRTGLRDQENWQYNVENKRRK